VFTANQGRFQAAGSAWAELGSSALEEVRLAQSVPCLLRFSMSALSSEDREFWTDFCRRIERRVSDADDWLYRLRQELPRHALANSGGWRFQYRRARHVLHGVEPRVTRPSMRPDQVDEFLGLGSCVLGAYSYLLRSQLVGLTSEGGQLLAQAGEGEGVAHTIRRRGDDDCTRAFLGAAATDSERVCTALSSVYRAIGNLYLMSGRCVGKSDRQAALRQARKNILVAYELLVADRPPWLHGIANTFVSGAAYRFYLGDLAKARRYLSQAGEYYRRTADVFRAAACDRAVRQLAADPETVDWSALIFVE
jgi:hypothetical protein